MNYRRGMSTEVVPNVFDFQKEPPNRPHRRESLRRELGFADDELLILQPTRVVPRKQIERAVDLVALLQPPETLGSSSAMTQATRETNTRACSHATPRTREWNSST